MAERKKSPPAAEATLQARLGEAIQMRRKLLGLTQEELAWRASLHRTYLADIERGGRNVTLRSIAQLAEALQVPLETLLGQARLGAAAGVTEEEAGEILLVEDCVEDAELALLALKRAKLTNPIAIARDGEAALDHVFGTGARGKRRGPKTPQLILLDLNLPNLSGVEVLRRLKADERTRVIPVVVLTMSRQDRTILECSRLGAENYIIKPLQFEALCQVTPKLRQRWALLRPAAALPPVSV